MDNYCDINCFLVPNHHGPHQYDPFRAEWNKKKSDEHNEYRRNNPEKTRSINLKCSHGITLEYYNKIFEKQKGVCAVCEQPETHVNQWGLIPLAVDHDRTCCPGDKSCGKCIRGLLCHKCNTAE